MAEIHLPTKVTQDSIKGDTQFIRGQFPISGGTDFSEGTFTTTSTGTHETNLVLNVQGKGFITHLISEGTSSTYTRHFSVQADNGQIIKVTLVTGGVAQVLIPFHSSAKIYCNQTTLYNIGYILL